jgi:hypothetical protein
MVRKIAFSLSSLCIVASGVMYNIGTNSSHLSELGDLFWLPLPLAAVSFLVGLKKKN